MDRKLSCLSCIENIGGIPALAKMARVNIILAKEVRFYRDIRVDLQTAINYVIQLAYNSYEFLISTLKNIIPLNTNAYVIQNGVLSKYSRVFDFLTRWYPSAANEFSQSYTEIFRYYYLYHFVKYGENLHNLQVRCAKSSRILIYAYSLLL